MSTLHESRRILAMIVEGAPLPTLADALLALAPSIEVRGPDTLLLDASAAHLFGGEEGLIEEAMRLVAGLFEGVRAKVAVADGLWPSIALARSGEAVACASAPRGAAPDVRRETRSHPRTLAKQTSRTLLLFDRSHTQTPFFDRVTPPGENRRALAGLPLEALDLPAPMVARLAALGLGRVGALADLPTESLTARFGSMGERAVKMSRGIDPTPLVPYAPVEHPSETIELEGGVEALEPLVFLVKGLADRLAARLTGRALGATQLALVAVEESRAETTIPIVLATPSSLVSAWMPVLREMLASLRLPTPIVRLSLAARGVARLAAEQLALDEHPERTLALETVLSRLESRLGEGSVLVAALADSHRPEAAFTLQRYSGKPSRAIEGPFAHRPTRLLARPQRIEIDAQRSVARVQGKSHAIEPSDDGLPFTPLERLGGEWWASPYQRDYQRVRLRGLGDGWIFRTRGQTYLHGWFD